MDDVTVDERGSMVPKIYLPYAQFADNRNWIPTQVVKSAGLSGDWLVVIRRELAAVDPIFAVHDARSMDQVLDTSRAR